MTHLRNGDIRVRIPYLDAVRDPRSGALSMDDVFQDRPCPSCGGTDREVVGWYDILPIAECRSCGMRYRPLFPTGRHPLGKADDRFRSYDEAISFDPAQLAIIRKEFARYLVPFMPAAEQPVFLDFGCGMGEFLETARTMGWSAHGVEINPDLRRAVSDGLGFPVAESLDGLDPDLRFDAVWMNYVACLLPDPKAIFAAIRDRLNPGGVLYLGEPNYGSHAVRRDGQVHYYYGPPQVNFFTKETLARMVADAGLGEVCLLAESKIHPYILCHGYNGEHAFFSGEAMEPLPDFAKPAPYERLLRRPLAIRAMGALRKGFAALGLRFLETSNLGYQIVLVARRQLSDH